ncbi:MAG: sigma-70 family RNA polymerase sigma factor [Clostridia bacterium]|nr:sigma-70 family RNA polymerase sigma factor [Clostridia bacterium]
MKDEAIIEMLFARSEKGIDEINKKYGRKCRSIALEIVGSEEDAEECINDAYLGVWNSIPPEKPKPLSTFIYRILRNVAMNRRRAAKRQKRACVYGEALDEIAETFAASETVESALESKDVQKILREFLLSLDKENRAIFMRRYWFMESGKSIAASLGMSENSVRVRLLRTREKLRKYLEERGVEV